MTFFLFSFFVSFFLLIQQEYAIQITFREQWRDDRLTYDDLGGKIRYLTLTDPDKIWKPDLFFSNEKDGHFHNIIMPNVLLRIFPNGDVLFSVRISLVLFCPMDLKYFPLDLQVCTIKMASYGYTTEDLVFLWKESDPVQVTSQLNLSRFTLLNFLTSYCTSRTNTGEYSCVKVDMKFKREFSYYLILIYVPCCMLVIVSWVSFWIDPNSAAARVLLGVTSLLTMSRLISSINASLPPVSYTKAVDVWTGACLTFVFSALIEFAVVNYVSRQDAHRADRNRRSRNSNLNGKKNKSKVSRGQQFVTTGGGKWNIDDDEDAITIFGHGSGDRGKDSGVESDDLDDSRFILMDSTSSQCIAHQRTPSVGSGGYTVHRSSVNRHGSTGRDTDGIYGHSRGHHSRNGSNGSYPGFGPFSGGSFGAGGSGPFGMDSFMDSVFSPRPRTRGLILPQPNFLRKWLNRFPTRSKRIDILSRVFFPLFFAVFNLFYWVAYLWRDDLKDLDI